MIGPTRPRGSSLALALTLALAGCKGNGSGGGTDERLRRNKDAGGAVELVDRLGGTVAADRPPEREPNNDPDTAGPFAGGVRGTLDGDTDVDAFTVVSPGPQVLTARVTGVAGLDLKLEVRDRTFAVVATADRAGAAASEGVVGVPLAKGTYYLVVREVVKRKKATKKNPDAGAGRVGPSATYELTTELAAAPAAGVEQEPNDDAGTANELTLGEPSTGSIGWSSDVDAWKLGIDAFTDGNGLDVAVTGVDGVVLTVSVTDAGGRTLMKGQGKPGEPVTLRSLAPRVTAGSAPVHFVLVAGRPSSHEVPYTLTVTSRLLDLDEEAEPNDRTSSSTQLRFGEQAQGSMRATIGPGDTDIFALSESSSAFTLDLAVDAPPGIDLAVEAIASNGSTLGKADAGGVGVAEALGALGVAHKTMVYLKVTAKPDKKGVSPAPYQLRWSVTEGAAPAPPVAGPSPDDDPLPPEE